LKDHIGGETHKQRPSCRGHEANDGKRQFEDVDRFWQKLGLVRPLLPLQTLTLPNGICYK